jgi:hypothetical protein
MPSRKKIYLDKVLASPQTPCPKCVYKIQPAEIRRVSFDEMICSAAGRISKWEILNVVQFS